MSTLHTESRSLDGLMRELTADLAPPQRRHPDGPSQYSAEDLRLTTRSEWVAASIACLPNHALA